MIIGIYIALGIVFFLSTMLIVALPGQVKLTRNPEHIPLNGADPGFEGEAGAVINALQNMHFIDCDGWKVDHGGATEIVRAFVSPDRETQATLTLSQTLNSDVGMTSIICSFYSRSNDGSLCRTNNYGKNDNFDIPPTWDNRRHPGVRDAQQLYLLHEAHRREWSKTVVPLDPTTTISRAVTLNEEHHQYRIESGLMREKGEIITGTMKCGYVAALMMLSPCGFEDHRGRARLKALALAIVGGISAYFLANLAAPLHILPDIVFVALTITNMLLFPNSRLITWVYLCIPAALMFNHQGTTGGGAWLSALVCAFVLGPIFESMRQKRVKKSIAKQFG